MPPDGRESTLSLGFPASRNERPATPLSLAEKLATSFSVEAAEWDRTSHVPADCIARLAEARLLALPLVSGGGPGLRGSHATAGLMAVLTAIGSGDLSAGRLYEGHINALLLSERFGSSIQRHNVSNSVFRHGQLLAVWNTDAATPVSLVPDGPSWRLDGAKRFASGAGLVGLALITARHPDGSRQMVMVPGSAVVDRIDTSSWRPLGMRASMSFDVEFTGLGVEPQALLGKPDDYLAEPWFSAGCIRFGAVQLGGALAILRVVHAHLRGLVVTGMPTNRSVTHRCASPFREHASG